MKATQTGHLCFSTLHTNGAAESVDPPARSWRAGYLIAASLTGIPRGSGGAHALFVPREAQHDQRSGSSDDEGRIVEPPKKMRVPVGCRNAIRRVTRVAWAYSSFRNAGDAARCSALHRTGRSIANAGAFLRDEDAARRWLGQDSASMTMLDEILRVVPKEMDSGVSCDSCGQSLISAFQFCPYCGARRPEGSPDVHRQGRRIRRRTSPVSGRRSPPS